MDGQPPARDEASVQNEVPPARGSVAAAQALAITLRRRLSGPGTHLALAASLLVSRHLRFDAADPHWQDRDRIIAAPSCAALAEALAALSGSPGIGMVARPALGAGVGLALGERMLAARFGRSMVDHKSWVFCAGATLAAGAAQEAAQLAGAWRLGRLTVLVDGDMTAAARAGFVAAGWTVRVAASDDAVALIACLSAAIRSHKPTAIICAGPETKIPDAPGDAETVWLGTGRRLAGVRRSWLKRLARHAARVDFEAAHAGRLPPRWHLPLSEPGSLLPPGADRVATAETARTAMAGLASAGMLPLLLADPDWPVPGHAGSPSASADAARFLALGMGAVLLGVALHGGAVPLCAQRGDASDSLLPGLRAAGRAGARLVLLLTEDDADCAATMRSVPHLTVFRPADAAETLECLELAIRRTGGPSVLLLSGKPQPLLSDRPTRTRAARGGYLLESAGLAPAATLVASGPELHTALAVRGLLAAAGLRIAVASLPCWDLFAQQDGDWQRQVLGARPRIAIEAGMSVGWERWLGEEGLILPAGDAPDLAGRVLRRLRGAGPIWTGRPGM